MKTCWLKEDKRLPKLPVIFSPEIIQSIEDIHRRNYDNQEALTEWENYIDGVIGYISNPVIAWDYVGRYPHFPNGAIFVNDFGYNAAFIVKTNFKTNQPFVYLFKLNLNLEAFGLKMLPLKEEILLSITESEIKNMVMECVCRIISEEPKCDYKVGKYEVVNGWDERDITPYLYHSLKNFGWTYQVKMYFSKDGTYCLLRRKSNRKLFFAKIVLAPELGDKATKFVPCHPKEVPQIILQDVQRFLWLHPERRGHNVIS